MVRHVTTLRSEHPCGEQLAQEIHEKERDAMVNRREMKKLGTTGGLWAAGDHTRITSGNIWE